MIGRAVALFVLEGRAWDTGLENLWVHVDSGVASTGSESAIRRCGCSPTTRAPASAAPSHLPGEAALATWLAHRCHRASLAPLFARLSRSAAARWSARHRWHTVGAAVVGRPPRSRCCAA